MLKWYVGCEFEILGKPKIGRFECERGRVKVGAYFLGEGGEEKGKKKSSKMTFLEIYIWPNFIL